MRRLNFFVNLIGPEPKAAAEQATVVTALGDRLSVLAAADPSRTVTTAFPGEYEGLRRDFVETVVPELQRRRLMRKHGTGIPCAIIWVWPSPSTAISGDFLCRPVNKKPEMRLRHELPEFLPCRGKRTLADARLIMVDEPNSALATAEGQILESGPPEAIFENPQNSSLASFIWSIAH